MLDLGRANGAVQIDQFVNALDIVRVRHTAFAMGKAFPAEIAILLMGIAYLAVARLRMPIHMRLVGIGRVVMHQLMFAVVMGFFLVVMVMAVIVSVVMIMVVIVIMFVVVVMFVIVLMLMVVTVIMVVLVLVVVTMIVMMLVVVRHFVSPFCG